MITLLSRLLIRDAGEYDDPKVRRRYGIVCSTFGIFLNMVLFGIKLFAGGMTGSVAITADAFNNLSDAGSSLVSLVGFHFAGKKPDREHPFGHGRFEYISGLFVAFLILLMGVELVKTSVEKIWHPQPVVQSSAAAVILALSVLVKLYMAFYNERIGRRIDSATMRATALDSLNDAVATTVVLLAMVVLAVTGVNLDGYGGIVVSMFILFTGWSAAKDTASPLLGKKPDARLIQKIYDIVLAYDGIIGVHDVIVHDYGPGRRMISLHAEVPGEKNIYWLHDRIELVEAALDAELHCESVIHMDPIESDNAVTAQMKGKVTELVKEISGELSIHDFRMIRCSTRTKLVFDVVLPPEFPLSDSEVRRKIASELLEQYPEYEAIIKMEKAYI